MPADWIADRAAIEAVRRAVFIAEQGFAESEEWDDRDAVCLHVLAITAKRDAVGTARLDVTGKIGRVAVLPQWRGQGIGARIVEELVDQAHGKGIRQVHLNAQVAALDFYRRLGFAATGEVFDEAGVPHQRMERQTVSTGS